MRKFRVWWCLSCEARLSNVSKAKPVLASFPELIAPMTKRIGSVGRSAFSAYVMECILDVTLIARKTAPGRC